MSVQNIILDKGVELPLVENDILHLESIRS